MGLFDRIQAKIELLRLEKRYTRRRNRRSTFVSNAIYVDGEYIYQTPTTTGSSSASHDSHDSDNVSPTFEAPSSYAHHPSTSVVPASMATKERKKMNRYSSMPGFGSNSRNAVAPAADWRMQRASFDGTR